MLAAPEKPRSHASLGGDEYFDISLLADLDRDSRYVPLAFLSYRRISLRLCIIPLLQFLFLASPGCDMSQPKPVHKGTPDPVHISEKPGQIVEEEMTRRVARDNDWFEDVTLKAGVDFSYHSGSEAGQFTMVETFGGGIALFDYDLDGDPDLLCIGGGDIVRTGNDQLPMLNISGRSPAFFRNDGNWNFVDVTRDVGLDGQIDYTHGCAVGDFDRDGDPDLLITCYGRSRLFRNEKGESFKDVSDSANLHIDGWSTSACFADVNGDGWPDLYVASYLQWKPDLERRCLDPKSGQRDVCMPGNFPGAQDRLFLNQQDGTFRDATKESGLLADGKGLGVVAADFNDDGWLDFFVANDVIRNHLYLGSKDGRFEEQAVLSGVSGNEFGIPEGSMGVDYADYNADGRGDIFVTNYELEDNSLYRNNGDGLFSHSTVPVGLASSCRPYVGFGTGFADFDSDGRLDLFVINGHVTYRNRTSPYRQPAFIFRQTNVGRFENVSEDAGPWFSVNHPGRGAAVGDLNNDGAPDLVVSCQDGPVSILRNRKPPSNWISVTLRGTKHDIDAVGAQAQLTVAGLTQTRFVRGGGSYLSYFDPRLLFAIVDGLVAKVNLRVQWPGGHEEVFQNLDTRQNHVIHEGSGIAATVSDEPSLP